MLSQLLHLAIYPESFILCHISLNLHQYEQRTDPTVPYTHLNLHSRNNLNDLSPVSALPRMWSVGNFTLALLTPHLFAWGGAGVWLAGSFVLANAGVGAGGKGQP
jgi:hypothetical protein